MTRTKSSRALVSVVLAVLMAVAFMPAISFSSFAATAKKATKVTKVYHKANTTFTRTAGTAWTLKYKLSPSKLTAAAKKVVWKSSNKSVVSVSAKSGNRAAVSFKKAGTATVTVYTKANKKAKATWKFKVVNAPAKVAATGVTVKANNSTDYTQTLSVGTVLTATVAPADATGVTYQWYADGTAISGATDAQFTVGADQIGKKITVKAKANTGDEVTSAESAKVADVTIDSLTIDKASTKVSVGDKVSVVANPTLTDEVAGQVLNVQWYRYKTLTNGNGKVDEAISGATGISYTATDADAGYQLYAIITPSTASGVNVKNGVLTNGKVTTDKTSAVDADSKAISAVAITADTTAATDGSYTTGTVLTAKTTPEAGASYVTYQWYRNGLQISGATSQSYTTDKAGSYTVAITLKSGEASWKIRDGSSNTTTSAAVTVKDATKSFSGVTVTISKDGVAKTTAAAGDTLGVDVSGLTYNKDYTVQWKTVTAKSDGYNGAKTYSNVDNATGQTLANVVAGNTYVAVVTGKAGTSYEGYESTSSEVTVPASTGSYTITNNGTTLTASIPTGGSAKIEMAPVNGNGTIGSYSVVSNSNTYVLTTSNVGTYKVRAEIFDANGKSLGYTAVQTLTVTTGSDNTTNVNLQ